MPEEVQAGYQKEFLQGKGCHASEWAEEGDRVTIPGGIQEMTGHGT